MGGREHNCGKQASATRRGELCGGRHKSKPSTDDTLQYELTQASEGDVESLLSNHVSKHSTGKALQDRCLVNLSEEQEGKRRGGEAEREEGRQGKDAEQRGGDRRGEKSAGKRRCWQTYY